jgi:hypothetical protein
VVGLSSVLEACYIQNQSNAVVFDWTAAASTMHVFAAAKAQGPGTWHNANIESGLFFWRVFRLLSNNHRGMVQHFFCQ